MGQQIKRRRETATNYMIERATATVFKLRTKLALNSDSKNALRIKPAQDLQPNRTSTSTDTGSPSRA